MSIENLAGEDRDSNLEQALKLFKQSMEAWSDAAYSRPRTVTIGHRHSWRLATGWALGCVLAAGSLAGVLYERQQRQEQARVAAMKAAAQQARELTASRQAVLPAAAPERTAAPVKPAVVSAHAEDENLLATVDQDVSRGVPAAMEPLAQMMNLNGNE